MPQIPPKSVFSSFLASDWDPKVPTKHKKGGSGMPWAETSQKNTLFDRFWAGSILENGAPVQAGARFSRNHSVQKSNKQNMFAFILLSL